MSRSCVCTCVMTSATTHTDLYLRCKEDSIPVEVVHNCSIMNAVGISGYVK